MNHCLVVLLVLDWLRCFPATSWVEKEFVPLLLLPAPLSAPSVFVFLSVFVCPALRTRARTQTSDLRPQTSVVLRRPHCYPVLLANPTTPLGNFWRVWTVQEIGWVMSCPIVETVV